MKIGISLCLGVLMCLNAGCTGKKSAAEEPELTYSNPLSVQFGDPYVLLASDGSRKGRFIGVIRPILGQSLISGHRKCTSVTGSSICSSARIGGTIRPTRKKISVSA